ncbi:MAG: hypothetical protein KDD52_00990 [Bdellovibrionales bacterium]|nr:hypothetical protein [Bdellovibrionales bacterium]
MHNLVLVLSALLVGVTSFSLEAQSEPSIQIKVYKSESFNQVCWDKLESHFIRHPDSKRYILKKNLTYKDSDALPRINGLDQENYLGNIAGTMARVPQLFDESHLKKIEKNHLAMIDAWKKYQSGKYSMSELSYYKSLWQYHETLTRKELVTLYNLALSYHQILHTLDPPSTTQISTPKQSNPVTIDEHNDPNHFLSFQKARVKLLLQQINAITDSKFGEKNANEISDLYTVMSFNINHLRKNYTHVVEKFYVFYELYDLLRLNLEDYEQEKEVIRLSQVRDDIFFQHIEMQIQKCHEEKKSCNISVFADPEDLINFESWFNEYQEQFHLHSFTIRECSFSIPTKPYDPSISRI